MEQEHQNYENSKKKAVNQRVLTRLTDTDQLDVKFWTGEWVWIPRYSNEYLHLWNPVGGPASRGKQIKIYWLCLAVSYLTPVED